MTRYYLNSLVSDDELIYKLLNHPKKGKSNNWIINCILDFTPTYWPGYIIDKLAEQLNVIDSALETVYGDNYDINIIYSLLFRDNELFLELFCNPSISILYKKIKITNSNGDNNPLPYHIIKDLLVTIPLIGDSTRTFYNDYHKTIDITPSHNGIYSFNLNFSWITGIRLTRNSHEINNYYNHSHLDIGSQNKLNKKFCLGNFELATQSQEFGFFETEFNNLIFAFISVNKYVSWESLEGGPYIKFAKLLPYRVIATDFLIKDRNIKYSTSEKSDKLIDELIRRNITDCFYIDGESLVRIDINHPDVYNAIEYLGLSKKYLKSGNKYYKEEPIDFTPDTANEYIKESTRPIYFKGEFREFNLEIVTNDNLHEHFHMPANSNNDKKFTPNDLDKLKRDAEIFCNSQIFRNSIKRKWNIQNEQRTNQQDTLVVQKYSAWR